MPHLADCNIAVCIGLHNHQRIARPVSCMASITYIFCVDINSSNRADGKPVKHSNDCR